MQVCIYSISLNASLYKLALMMIIALLAPVVNSQVRQPDGRERRHFLSTRIASSFRQHLSGDQPPSNSRGVGPFIVKPARLSA